MRALTGFTQWVRWRLAGRPIDTTPPSYGPWMAAFDAIRPPPRDPLNTFSVVCPVFDTPAHLLAACIESVDAQTYPNVELVVVDDASTSPATIAVLSSLARRPRTRVLRNGVNEGIAAATNTGIDAANGDYVAFLDHDDALRPDALEWMALALDRAEVAYSDEDQLSPLGDRMYPFMKPGWSPHLLLGMNYINHLTAIRRDTVRAVGGLDGELVGAQDHDLLLRLAEAGVGVTHLPKVLYNWRQAAGSVAGNLDAKPWALDAARRAVEAAVRRRCVDADVVDAVGAGPYRFALRFLSTPGSIEFAAGQSSREINRLVDASVADIVIVSTSDAPLSGDDHRQLAGWLSDPSVGAVGPKIVDGFGSVREAGWIVAVGAARPYGYSAQNAPVPFLEVARDASAVGGNGLAVRRSEFLNAGGLDESLTPDLAGVLLSHRLGPGRGRVCIVEPAVTLSVPIPTGWAASIQSPSFVGQDPFVSPHTLNDGQSIAPPPDVAERAMRLMPRTIRFTAEGFASS